MTLTNNIFFWGVIITMMVGNPIAAQESAGGKEYALKAAFLYRFIDYVNWKDYSKNQTFKIAILEESPITSSLQGIPKTKKIDIKEYKNLDEISFCNILFVPYDSTVPIETILSKFSGKPVLIVTEPVIGSINIPKSMGNCAGYDAGAEFNVTETKSP